MSRTIVITGATGFIGGMLVKKLASTGWRIRGLVRKGSYQRCPSNVPVEWITGDLDDRDSLQRLTAGSDTIVHCAGKVRGTGKREFNQVNVDGLTHIVQAAAQQKTPPRFLLISSLAAREPQLSDYAASKYHGEQALRSFSGKMFWNIFRPSAVYGPGDREMLPLFQWMFRGLAPIIGPNENRVSLLHVEDLADAVLSWLYLCEHSGKIYELHDGHHEGYSWQEVIYTVQHLRGKAIIKANIPIFLLKMIGSLNLKAAKVLNNSPMLTPGKVRELMHPDWVADNSLFNTATGWVPNVSLEEGLRQLLGPVL